MTFSKHDTQIAKGVAAFFLICFHCFSTADRLEGYSVSFAPFSESLGFSIFWATYICVGMFVFLSAFAMTRMLKAQQPSLLFSPLEQLQFITKRLLAVIPPFLFTAAICLVVEYIVNGRWIYGSGVTGLLNLALELLGLSDLLGSPILCGAWWFMGLMWIMLLLFPLILGLYRRYGVLVLPLFVFLYVLLPLEGRPEVIMRWMTVVPVGIFCADHDLLERWKEKRLVSSPALNTLLKLAIMLPATLAAGALFQSSWGHAHLMPVLVPLFSVLMVADVYLFLADVPVLSRLLAFLGRHSAYIFYVHSMIRHNWLLERSYSFGHWLPIALFVLASSIVCSYVVQLLQRMLHWSQITSFLCGKLLHLEEKLLTNSKAAV